MLSVKKCKTILEDNGCKKYSTSEVEQIREFLYNAARVVIKNKKDQDEAMDGEESSINK